jgi:hypothetical protein
VGFALETDDAVENGRRKLEGKGLDLLVVNDATEPGAGFEVETNRVVLLAPGREDEALPLLTKAEVADRILDRVEEHPGRGRARMSDARALLHAYLRQRAEMGETELVLEPSAVAALRNIVRPPSVAPARPDAARRERPAAAPDAAPSGRTARRPRHPRAEAPAARDCRFRCFPAGCPAPDCGVGDRGPSHARGAGRARQRLRSLRAGRLAAAGGVRRGAGGRGGDGGGGGAGGGGGPQRAAVRRPGGEAAGPPSPLRGVRAGAGVRLQRAQVPAAVRTATRAPRRSRPARPTCCARWSWCVRG